MASRRLLRTCASRLTMPIGIGAGGGTFGVRAVLSTDFRRQSVVTTASASAGEHTDTIKRQLNMIFDRLSASTPTLQKADSLVKTHVLKRGQSDGWAFSGKVYIIDSKTSAAEERYALRKLYDDAATLKLVPDAKCPLGVDTETRVLWRDRSRKNTHKTSLLQLSSPNACVVYRLHDIRQKNGDSGISQQLSKLLNDRQTVLFGIGVVDDMAKLAEENNNVNAIKNVVELNDLTDTKRWYGLKSLAETLQPSRGNVVKKKSIILSDWAKPLSAEHIQYAATDAWLGLELAHLLVDRMQTKSASRDGEDNQSGNDIVLKDLKPRDVFSKRYRSRQQAKRVQDMLRFISAALEPNLNDQHGDKLRGFALNEHAHACVVHAVDSPQARFHIHVFASTFGFFSFSCATSDAESNSKTIVILRLASPDHASSLKESMEAVDGFRKKTLTSEEKLQHISIPVIEEKFLPSYFRYPNFADSEARHISEILVHYKANVLNKRSDWVFECKRNPSDPALIDLWGRDAS